MVYLKSKYNSVRCTMWLWTREI